MAQEKPLMYTRRMHFTFPGVDHIYVIHFPAAHERKKAMDQWIAHHKFSTDYATYRHAFPTESLNKGLIQKVYLPSPSEHARRSNYTTLNAAVPPGFPLSIREIAVGLGHH